MTIRDVIERHGYLAHRGDPDGAGEAWEEAGIEAGEVDDWLNARCFDPDAAEDLDDVGITSEIASSKTGTGNGSYSTRWATRSRSATSSWRTRASCWAFSRLAPRVRQQEACRADPAAGRSRYGDVSMARPDVLVARESKRPNHEHDR